MCPLAFSYAVCLLLVCVSGAALLYSQDGLGFSGTVNAVGPWYHDDAFNVGLCWYAGVRFFSRVAVLCCLPSQRTSHGGVLSVPRCSVRRPTDHKAVPRGLCGRAFYCYAAAVPH